jgi:hypothetical protein
MYLLKCINVFRLENTCNLFTEVANVPVVTA